MTQLTAKPFTARPLAARPFTAYPFGESTSVSNPLVWLAAYPDSDGVMQAQVTGEGTPSFTVDDGLLLPDHEGIYRTTAEDTPPWHGARKVTNEWLYSNDVSDAAWIASESGTATIDTRTANYSTAPDGTQTASRLVLNLNGGTSSGDIALIRQAVGAAGVNGRHSIWLKSNSGASVVVQIIDYTGGATNITVTTEWQRFANTGGVQPVSINAGVRLRGGQGTADVADLSVWGSQYERVTGQSNQNPSEYVPTTSAAASKYFSYENGNTVSSNVVSSAQGATLDPLPSLYGGPSYTNSLTFSNDLTQWSQVGTSVSALDAIGLTGAPNTATTLTDDNGAGYEYIQKNVTVSNNSDTHVLRAFILKDSDETRYPEIQVVLAGGTGQQVRVQINTKTGALVERGSIGTTAIEVRDAGVFWELLASVANNSTGNTTVSVYVWPAITTVFGSAEVAATGSCVVGNAELHLNKTIAQVRGSSPIVTAASTVTTTAISMSYDIANHSDEKGLYTATFTPQWSDGELNNTFSLASSRGATSGQFYSQADDRVVLYDDTNSVSSTPTIAFVKGTEYFAAVGYDSNESYMWAQMNSNRSADTAYDGAFSVAQGYIAVLGGLSGVCFIKDIRRYSLNLTAGKDKATELAP